MKSYNIILHFRATFVETGRDLSLRVALFLSISLLFLSSCTKPEWNNPFGKDCPPDSWTPTNFNATQEGNTVKLSWNQDVKLISCFKLVRKVENLSEMTLPNLSKDLTQYIDIAPTGGKQHNYSLTALAGSNQSNTVTIQITPLFAPTLSTPVVGSVTSSSAAFNCSVTSDGGSAITARGICWATTQDPTIAGNKTNDGSGAGTYTSNISGLTAGAIYYARAYATNSLGTAYSAQINFTASLVLSLPTVTTLNATNITSSTVTLGSNAVSDGNAAISERGVCISTSPNPTTANKFPHSTAAMGIFISNFSAMQSGTTYYVRAYAINSKGTAYGNEITFTTAIVLSVATLTTANATDITTTSATLGGNVTADGNAPVTERGVYFGTTQNATTQIKYSNGAGLGSFKFNFIDMTPNTTYYVRAYAVNSQGMAFGDQLSFTTSALTLSLPTVATVNASNITTTTAILGGRITADGNAPVTERGICISTSKNPTTVNKYPIGSGQGSFATGVTGLVPSTTYYIRAYAINSVGTAYGEEFTFTTDSLPLTIPTVTTTAPVNVTNTTATLGGTVTSDGNAFVTERGVCIDTNPNPTTALKQPSQTNGTGTFSLAFTGLTPNTTYYVRAYAKNSQGTAYGGEVSFKTTP